MLAATRIALPRSLDKRGFTLKSKMMSATTRSMRALELSTFCIVPHLLFNSSFCQSLSPLVLASNQASILLSEPSPLVDVPRFIDEVKHHLVLDGFAELVGVDVA